MSFTFKVTDKTIEAPEFSNPRNQHVVHTEVISRSEPLNAVNKHRVLNGFVNTIVQAYSSHHHLILRPDDVWLSIMTQFSAYVEGNAETLRERLVEHPDKKELEIKADGTMRTADYTELCNIFTVMISENIKDPSIREWVIPNFSTTTPTDKMAGAIALMASMKSYFTYKISFRCGLPQVTLLGTEEDWEELQNRAKKLLEFDNRSGHMVKWYKMLGPVLQNLTDSRKGHPNLQWWNKICNKIELGSGPRWLTGWVTTFCVFNDTGKWVGDKSYDEWIEIDVNDIPKGFLQVDVLISDNGTKYNTELIAGHMSTYTPDDKSVQPHVEWLLRIKGSEPPVKHSDSVCYY